MQASVHRYTEASDARPASLQLVTDAGTLIDVPPAVLAASGLRALRIGQRLAVESDTAGAPTALTIPGLTPRATPTSPF